MGGRRSLQLAPSPSEAVLEWVLWQEVPRVYCRTGPDWTRGASPLPQHCSILGPVLGLRPPLGQP